MVRRAGRRPVSGLSLACTLPVACVVALSGCGRTPRASDAAPILIAAGGSPSAGATSPAVPVVAQAERLSPANAGNVVEPVRLARLLDRNLDPRVSLPETLLARRLSAWENRPLGERVARWAQFFAGRDDNVYCFGPKLGGYVAESLLVQDYKFDCVLLFYRCTELARATSAREAVLLALGTRFAGGDPARVVSPAGGVDYDAPSHLDYSEDFAATGLWGRDVTREVGLAVPDSIGTSRYPAGSRVYIPSAALRYEELRDGDLLFFVLDERQPGAERLRREYGLLVGHQGIVRVQGGEVFLVHAAQSDLPSVYSGNQVVEVALQVYLSRVRRFKGVMVSRLEGKPIPAAAH